MTMKNVPIRLKIIQTSRLRYETRQIVTCKALCIGRWYIWSLKKSAWSEKIMQFAVIYSGWIKSRPILEKYFPWHVCTSTHARSLPAWHCFGEKFRERLVRVHARLRISGCWSDAAKTCLFWAAAPPRYGRINLRIQLFWSGRVCSSKVYCRRKKII